MPEEAFQATLMVTKTKQYDNYVVLEKENTKLFSKVLKFYSRFVLVLTMISQAMPAANPSETCKTKYLLLVKINVLKLEQALRFGLQYHKNQKVQFNLKYFAPPRLFSQGSPNLFTAKGRKDSSERQECHAWAQH